MMSLKNFLLEEAEAMKLMQDRHGKQKYGEYPYFFHLYQVNSVAKEFGLNDRVILLATWLHDALEDTATSPNDLIRRFGKEVAVAVYYVTDQKGWTREERHERAYREMANYPDAVAVKLCDRLANVRFGDAAKDGYSPMYRKEYPLFRELLFGNSGKWEEKTAGIWAELDKRLGYEAQV